MIVYRSRHRLAMVSIVVASAERCARWRVLLVIIIIVVIVGVAVSRPRGRCGALSLGALSLSILVARRIAVTVLVVVATVIAAILAGRVLFDAVVQRTATLTDAAVIPGTIG